MAKHEQVGKTTTRLRCNCGQILFTLTSCIALVMVCCQARLAWPAGAFVMLGIQFDLNLEALIKA